MSTFTDVGLAIFGSIVDPKTGETFMVTMSETVPVEFMAPTSAQRASTCSFPTPGLRPCMLRTGHSSSCLPAPEDRGSR